MIADTDAIALMEKNNQNFQYPVSWGIDIQTEHERYLAETIFNKPVFVTDYPKDIKAFYMKQNLDGKTVKMRKRGKTPPWQIRRVSYG